MRRHTVIILAGALSMREVGRLCLIFCAFLPTSASLTAQTPDHTGQITPPYPLGELIRQSDPIVVLEVDRIDREKRLVVFKSVKSLKGQADPGLIRHHLYETDLAVLDWASPGKKAVCFYHGGKAETYLGNHWYYHWNFGEHADPPVWTCADWVDGFLRTYVGPVEKLCDHVTAILNGRDVVVTAQAPEDRVSCLRPCNPVDRDWRRGQKSRVWRIKAGSKAVKPVWSDESPQFVGWGVGGAEIVPSLCAALTDKGAFVRAEAVEDLGRLGGVAKPALPALRQALTDADGFVRVYTVAALARIDPESKPDLSVLGAALKDKDAALRRAAAGVVSRLRPPAVSAVPDLITLLKDDSDSVCEVAAFALGEMESALPFLTSGSEEVVAALGQALHGNREERVRLQAACALLKFGARSWAAAPALRAALVGEERSRATAAVAADILARLDPPAVEILAEAVQDKNCAAPAEVAECLGRLGSRARLGLSALQRAPESDEDPRARCEKARALLAINRQSSLRIALPILMELLEGDLPHVSLAFVTLGELGADAKRAVPLLVRALNEREYQGKYLAVEALGKIGPDAREAIPALRAIIRDNPNRLGIAAAEALWRVGDSAEAAPILVQRLKDKYPRIRAAAAGALGRIGPAAKETLPALRQALKRADDPVHARLALAAIMMDHPLGRSGDKRICWAKAVAALAELQSDGDYGWDTPRTTFAETARMGAFAFDEDLVATWQDEDAEFDKQVKSLLRRLASEVDPVPLLAKASLDKSIYARVPAALALARIQPQHPRVIAVFMQTLEKRCGLSYYFSNALIDLGPNARIAVPWLVEALKHKAHEVYLAAFRALQRIDHQATDRVWSARGLLRLRAGLTGATTSSRQLEDLWTELASQHSGTVYQSLWKLILAGESVVPFLKQRLRAAPSMPPQAIEQLVKDLDSNRFEARRNATHELEQIIEQAETKLRQALAARPSLEVRQRAEQLLEKLDPRETPDRMRALRALGILEHIGTPEAKEIITKLAEGPSVALLTQEAKASLERLGKRSSPSP